jgi:hypothetical protein
MKHLPALASFASFALATSLAAQTYQLLPASAQPALELPNYTLIPLMQPASRVQAFYDAVEAGGSTLTIHELAFRYDGPIPQVGHPGPFQIQRLRIRVGATSVAMPEARFGANLTQPLTQVFDGAWTFSPDPGSVSPHPFGGPGTSLTFPFASPATVTIPAGGWLVVEIVMEGNNIANFGFAHALLDGITTAGGTSNGTALSFGQGCSTGGAAPAATIGSTGTYAPGAAHFVNGRNLGANAPVFAVFGLSNSTSPLGPLPLVLPGTACTALVSPDLAVLLFADAAGSIANDTQAAAFAVPADPAFAGLQIFEQLVAIAPGANALGIATSDALEVALGTIAPPAIGTYLVAHDSDASAEVANTVRPFGYALRIRTQ